MAERNTPATEGKRIGLALAADAVAEKGNMAAVNASGYGVPASDTAGLVVMGRWHQTKDNTGGSNGDLVAEAERKEAYLFANSTGNPVTQADVGSDVYVEDSGTVASSSVNSIVAGKCLGLESSGVWVEID